MYELDSTILSGIGTWLEINDKSLMYRTDVRTDPNHWKASLLTNC